MLLLRVVGSAWLHSHGDHVGTGPTPLKVEMSWMKRRLGLKYADCMRTAVSLGTTLGRGNGSLSKHPPPSLRTAPCISWTQLVQERHTGFLGQHCGTISSSSPELSTVPTVFPPARCRSTFQHRHWLTGSSSPRSWAKICLISYHLIPERVGFCLQNKWFAIWFHRCMWTGGKAPFPSIIVTQTS